MSKAALVTGGSQGIGRAIVEELVNSLQCDVLIDHYPGEKMKADAADLCEVLKKKGVKALAFGADVTNKEQVEQMMEAADKAFGGIDILVNNAGILRDRTVAKMDDKEWYTIIDVNLNGAFLVTRAALPILRDGGSIVGISSISGVYGNFGQSNYAASKAGVIGFYKSLAKELGRKKIRVNAVAPGLVNTELTKEHIPKEAQERIQQSTPLGRLAEPEEIARAVRFLASDEASYITGHVLHVDGGLTF